MSTKRKTQYLTSAQLSIGLLPDGWCQLVDIVVVVLLTGSGTTPARCA